MKQLIAIASLLLITISVVFVSCEKDGNDVLAKTTTSCKDSAWLIADSLVCTGKNFFQVYGSNKLIAVPTGIAAIDTIAGNAFFYITYDSVTGTTPCHGAIFQNAILSCYQRK